MMYHTEVRLNSFNDKNQTLSASAVQNIGYSAGGTNKWLTFL